jgi:hypothetical protein
LLPEALPAAVAKARPSWQLVPALLLQITPLLSLLQAVIEAKARNDPAVAGLQHVEVVWVARYVTMFTILPEEVIAADR